MKSFQDTVGIREEGEVKILGEFTFSEFETTAEAIEKFGEEIVLALINRSWTGDLQRTAREACKKTGEAAKSTEEIQTLLNDYKPGVRTAKVNLKNYNELMGKLAAQGKTDVLMAGIAIYTKEGLEAAYNYFMENK